MANEEVPCAPNNTPQHSPARSLRTQAEDARAYRREHDLCFYCGGENHTLKDCYFAPHNRGVVVHPSPGHKVSNSNLSNGRAPACRISVYSNKSNMSGDASSGIDDEPMSPGTAAARADPGLLRRLGLTGTPPSDLTETQWQECLNARPKAISTDNQGPTIQVTNLAISDAVNALKRYIMIRFPDPIGRCPSPSIEPNPAERGRIQSDVHTWEHIPMETKRRAVELLKPTEEQKLMSALDIIGDKIMKDAPKDTKLAFATVFEFCMKDEEDGPK